MSHRLVGLAVVLLAAVPTLATDPPAKAASDEEIKKLIDQLARVGDSDTGYSGTMTGSGFLPLGWRQFGAGLLFQKPSVQSDVMLRLVRAGAAAVPHLAAHLDDQRPTGITLKYERFFGTVYFGDEYDFNARTTPAPKRLKERDSDDDVKAYTVKAGDLCFVALGQIVNRNFNAVRYQPSAIIVLSSPTHSEAFRKIIADEWGKLTPEGHRASLLRDLTEPDGEARRNGASLRLAYYYPDALEPVALKELARPAFDVFAVHDLVRDKLYPAKTAAERKALLDAFVAKQGPIARDGVEDHLFDDLDTQEANEEGRLGPPLEKPYRARECLIELFGKPANVKSTDRPKVRPLSIGDQAGFVETLVYDRSPKLDKAVRDLFVKTNDDYMAEACMRRLVGRGYDADIEAYLKRKLPAAKDDDRDELLKIQAKLGWTRLHQAVDLGVVELVERELKAKVPVDARARDGRTALHLAAADGKAAIVEVLLTAKADVGSKDGNGRLAVQLAAQQDYPAIVRKLVENGSDVTDAFVAATVGKADRLAAVLKADPAQLAARNDDGLTPLHVAAREGHPEAVRALLDAGAKAGETDNRPETRHRNADSNGWTPLHLAAMAGQARTAELLLDRGADVNAADARGKFTPLHYAAWNGEAGLIQLLLARKANRAAKDEKGRTPLDLARERKNEAAIKLLEMP